MIAMIETLLNKWTIEYDNHVDGEDSFTEWWEVSDGYNNFKASNEESAKWLCGVLNTMEGGVK